MGHDEQQRHEMRPLDRVQIGRCYGCYRVSILDPDYGGEECACGREFNPVWGIVKIGEPVDVLTWIKLNPFAQSVHERSTKLIVALRDAIACTLY